MEEKEEPAAPRTRPVKRRRKAGPDAEYKVSDAQDFHGATFGEEVDEEPNVPQWLDKDVENTTIPSKKSQVFSTAADKYCSKVTLSGVISSS